MAMTWIKPTSVPELRDVKVMAIDTETYDPKLTTDGPGFITGDSYPIGISIYTDTGISAYYPIAHWQDNVEFPIIEFLRDRLEYQQDKNLTIVGANTRYDLESMWKIGIRPTCKIEDIQVIDSILDENQTGYSLDKIAVRRGFPGKNNAPMEKWMIEHGMVSKGKVDYSRLREVPPSVVGPYAAMDAELTYKIYIQQQKQIQDEELQTVAQLESDLIPILFEMRLRGVRVDIDKAIIESDKLKEQLAEDFKQFPKGLDPWSSGSMSKWIANEFGLAIPQTEKGNDSVSNDWLLASGIPELIALANWRKGEKIRRDFIQGMILEDSFKGRLHPQWFQTRGSSFMSGDDLNGTRSGRIACIKPNLTQIPSRHPVYGPLVRGLFVPEQGEIWNKNDYSSQEPRITVHYAYILGLDGAETVRKMYMDNPATDFHQAVTDIVNAGREDKITRTQGKTINLGLAYGMGVKKLAKGLGLTDTDTKVLLEKYHNKVPFMKALLQRCAQVATDRGYVKTILGRRRRYEEWENAEFGATWERPKKKDDAAASYARIRRAGTYKAINSIVQGSAAEQTKSAIVRSVKEHGLYPLMQVYDELSYSLSDPMDVLKIKDCMENAIKFEVPHLVDSSLGSSWADAKKENYEKMIARTL